VTPREFALDALQLSPTHAGPNELRPFNLALSVHSKISRPLKSLYPKNKYLFRTESAFKFKQYRKAEARNIYVQGYWQSEKYFASIEDQLRPMLEPKVPYDSETLTLMDEISRSNSLCVNVRRGDFAQNNGRNFHGLMGVEYYEKGVRFLRDRNAIDKIYIFSDEPDWCEKNLRLSKDQVVVHHRFAGPEFTHYLHLMSKCKYYVIPNSSFAWWAIWLSGTRAHEVVAPTNWFLDQSIDTSDLVSDMWFRM